MRLGGLQNEMRRQAEILTESIAHPRYGHVTSVDPNKGVAKVKLQPEDVETGWLSIWTPWAGQSWGVYCPPRIGAQVLVLFTEGNVESGLILGALYNDDDAAPETPVGELWVVHEEGAFLQFKNGGKVLLNAPDGLDITANTTIDGTLAVTGNISSEADVEDFSAGAGSTLKAVRDAYNAHKHTGVQAGGATSAITDHVVPT